MEAESEVDDVCYVCYDPAADDNPLRSPCLCDGSLKWIHQACLSQWILSGKHTQCAQCKFSYQSDKPMAKIQMSDVITEATDWLNAATKKLFFLAVATMILAYLIYQPVQFAAWWWWLVVGYITTCAILIVPVICKWSIFTAAYRRAHRALELINLDPGVFRNGIWWVVFIFGIIIAEHTKIIEKVLQNQPNMWQDYISGIQDLPK